MMVNYLKGKQVRLLLALLVFSVVGFTGCSEGSSSDISDLKSEVNEIVEDAKGQTEEDAKESEEESKSVKKKAEKEKKETEEEPETKKDPYDDMDRATQNAVKSARSYLDFKGFSKQGLIDQLSSEYGDGFTEEQAKDAVQYLEDQKEVNWKKQAVRAAESYLDFKGFSRQGLIDQLTSEYGDKFTKKQAEYAADKVGL